MSQSKTPVDDFLMMIAMCVDSMPVESTAGALRPVAEELTRLRSALTAVQEREKAAEARCAELREAMHRAKQRANESGAGEMRLIDTISAVHEILAAALAKEAKNE